MICRKGRKTRKLSLVERVGSQLENGGGNDALAKVIAGFIGLALVFISIFVIGPFWLIVVGVNKLRSLLSRFKSLFSRRSQN